MVQDPLAMKILDGEVLHGSHVRIDVDRKTTSLRLSPWDAKRWRKRDGGLQSASKGHILRGRFRLQTSLASASDQG